MKRGTIIAGLLVAAHAGCVDTHLPDLTDQLGAGRTAAGPCTIDDLGELPPETLQMHVIDVGQGDAIWIRTPYYNDSGLESLDILIDTGPPDWSESPGGAIVVDYMTRFGRSYEDPIDAVVITHAHNDHYGGLEQVAEAFFVERYYGPTYVPTDSPLRSTRANARALTDRKAPGSAFMPEDGFDLADELMAETDLFGGYVDAHLLWAAHAPPPGSDENDTSIVLSLSWSDRRILLMGDAEEHVEEQLVAAHDEPNGFSLAAHVLKVGHHGSSTSSTEDFLERVLGDPDERDEPIWAVISSGRKSFGGTQLPSAGTVDRLRDHLQPYHLLSTENGDEDRSEGEEHNDDHVLVTIGPNGEVRACYVP